MLQAIFLGLMLAAAYGCMYIIYGREGMKRRQQEGKNNLLVLIGLALLMLFWAMCLLFLLAGIAAKDTALAVVVVLGVPVLIAFLAIWARGRHKEEDTCTGEASPGVEDKDPADTDKKDNRPDM